MNSCTDDEDDCKGIIVNNKLIKLYFWKIFMFYLIILDLGSYNRYDLKNRDADMGNPNLNVYHSIDEMDGKKVEHVYDEIKQNNDESEYDQLNNPRPISNYKQFNLMPNGFCSNSSDNAGPSNFKDKDSELDKM